VGAVVPPTDREKTYRLFVEELPPSERQGTSNGVAMLTRMGIPIFLQPARPTAQAALQDLALRAGHFTFTVRNTGSAHLVPQAVRVRALDGSGAVLDEQKPAAWYILAGGSRTYDVALPAERCAAARSLAVDVQLESTTLRETLPAPAGACAR
jgi:fimbrial chaperone protein